MSYKRNSSKLPDKNIIDLQATGSNDDEAQIITCNPTESCTYAVTVSKRPSSQEALCLNQKSFISIHSTDHLCQVADTDNASTLEECNLEVLSLNEVFPSTSEESFSNDEDSLVSKKVKHPKKVEKMLSGNAGKSTYVPINSKSTTGARQKEPIEGQTLVFSDFDIPKNTLYVVGSNPGEPKMSYQDSPKKISKTTKLMSVLHDDAKLIPCLKTKRMTENHNSKITLVYKSYVSRENSKEKMKKFLRNIDKHKNEQGTKTNEKALSKLTTMRGILKDGRCGPECTGDSLQETEQLTAEDLTLPFPMDFSHHTNYTKQGPDKSVSFNTQVVIIHFTGDLCVGQSVETLSKEKDQQARNSELRKTYLTKYNEFWHTEK